MLIVSWKCIILTKIEELYKKCASESKAENENSTPTSEWISVSKMDTPAITKYTLSSSCVYDVWSHEKIESNISQHVPTYFNLSQQVQIWPTLI